MKFSNRAFMLLAGHVMLLTALLGVGSTTRALLQLVLAWHDHLTGLHHSLMDYVLYIRIQRFSCMQGFGVGH
jgi:hypothetical protein